MFLFSKDGSVSRQSFWYWICLSPTIVSEAWIAQDWENSSDGGACVATEALVKNLWTKFRLIDKEKVGPMADGE